MSRLAVNRLLILWSPHKSLRCFKTGRTTFLSSDIQDLDRGNSNAPKTHRVLTVYICLRDGVWNFSSASDQNHTITPIVTHTQSMLPFHFHYIGSANSKNVNPKGKSSKELIAFYAAARVTLDVIFDQLSPTLSGRFQLPVSLDKT